MAARVTVTMYIDSTPNRVFGFLRDANQHRRWSGGLQHISHVGSLHPGATYETTHIMLGREIKSTNRDQSLVTNRILEIQNMNGPIEYRILYALTPSGNGTSVACTCTVESRHVAFRLAAPVFEMMVEAQLERDLGNLRDAAQAKHIAS